MSFIYYVYNQYRLDISPQIWSGSNEMAHLDKFLDRNVIFVQQFYLVKSSLSIQIIKNSRYHFT